jgi:hypothetical protein
MRFLACLHEVAGVRGDHITVLSDKFTGEIFLPCRR